MFAIQYFKHPCPPRHAPRPPCHFPLFTGVDVSTSFSMTITPTKAPFRAIVCIGNDPVPEPGAGAPRYPAGSVISGLRLQLQDQSGTPVPVGEGTFRVRSWVFPVGPGAGCSLTKAFRFSKGTGCGVCFDGAAAGSAPVTQEVYDRRQEGTTQLLITEWTPTRASPSSVVSLPSTVFGGHRGCSFAREGGQEGRDLLLERVVAADQRRVRCLAKPEGKVKRNRHVFK